MSDVLVIGSGFGGGVAALRLAEKGFDVTVLEAGRRFRPQDFPKTSWRVRKFLWAPRLGCFGIQRLTRLRDVVVLSGAGVGGGSLVYAGVLWEPPAHVWPDPARAEELAPYGVVRPRPQARPGELRTVLENGRLTTEDDGAPPTSSAEAAHAVARAAARLIRGYPGASLNEALLGIPMTAHVLGGATDEHGVIDRFGRVRSQPACTWSTAPRSARTSASARR